MIKIFLIAGARPNFMKLAPLYFELKKHAEIFEPLIVHTGQHYDYTMSKVFFEQFGLPEPDFFLEVGSGSHAHQTGQIMIRAEEIMQEQRPDMVIIFGDVNSTLAGAIAASKLCIPVAHVEAGLRSFDRTMPEEINRVVSDVLSSMLFTSCDDANLNLIKEGIPVEKVFLVGNIMIDTLKHFLPEAEKSNVLDRHGLESKNYILMTLHRPSNVDDPENLKKIAEIITLAAERQKIIFPIHPRTRERLDTHAQHGAILNNMNVVLTEPLGYFDFIKLQKNAGLVMTDSGGIQEETTFLGIPCLTLRKNTERPVTLTDGTNRLTGLDINKIMAQIDYYSQGGVISRRRPILWDGQTSERIVRILREFFADKAKQEDQADRLTSTDKIIIKNLT
jgi:UDP-N-acetylglucosamine 2-epimerase (non-hydrolysing)